MGRGDALASGARSATFSMGGDDKDAPITLHNVAPEGDLVSHVDNSKVLYEVPKPRAYYKPVSPLSDRILVKRVEARDSGSTIIIPDSAKGKSDLGRVVCVTPFAKTGLKPGALILFDKYAAVGMEIMLGDEFGEVSEHLIVQECDVLMEMELCQPEAREQ